MTYLFSLGAGLLVGVVYGLLGVRSPAPPVIALLGLLGILAGEQIVPIAQRLFRREPLTLSLLAKECGEHLFGTLPANSASKRDGAA
ncbi:DUF1427 family protein [Roseomonas elaeocarpi]|uniref:DUF1427 family protein n=1 Tax=Roseomonas elaeocarpi TaxID=907779 RepID=A0ABV6JYW6_9PROT